MSSPSIAIKNTGLVTSVGLSAPAACAAIRAKVANPSETGFLEREAGPIIAHQAPLDRPWRGRARLVRMAAMALVEALGGLPRAQWTALPLLLCVAERDRPGRIDGLEDQLLREVEREIGTRFAAGSATIAGGRVGICAALSTARRLLYEGRVPFVLIGGADSLVTWSTLQVLAGRNRLLNEYNSNGFMAGEAAGAVLVGLPEDAGELVCAGCGQAFETAHIGSGQPLRGTGLSSAIKAALDEAGCQLRDLSYRITDLSGEQYYFKEAALAVARIPDRPAGLFDLWHPAECIGEAGAAAGFVIIAVAEAACRKAYAPGERVLVHLANDGGQRGAAVLYRRALR